MFCPKCGAENPDGANSCANCVIGIEVGISVSHKVILPVAGVSVTDKAIGIFI